MRKNESFAWKRRVLQVLVASNNESENMVDNSVLLIVL